LIAPTRANALKRAHLQVEGELRSREYDKDGVKHKAFERWLESILKILGSQSAERPRNEHEGTDEILDGPEQRV